jgi:hypothetical protein
MSSSEDVLTAAAHPANSVISIHSSSLTNTSGYSESIASTVAYSGTLSVVSATTGSVYDPAYERTLQLFREGQLWLYLFHLDNLYHPGNPLRGQTRWVVPPGVTHVHSHPTVHPQYTHISLQQPPTVHSIPFTSWPATVDDHHRSYFTRYRDITVHRPPYRFTAPTTGRTYWFYF